MGVLDEMYDNNKATLQDFKSMSQTTIRCIGFLFQNLMCCCVLLKILLISSAHTLY